jgi:hypothetical protein
MADRMQRGWGAGIFAFAALLALAAGCAATDSGGSECSRGSECASAPVRTAAAWRQRGHRNRAPLGQVADLAGQQAQKGDRGRRAAGASCQPNRRHDRTRRVPLLAGLSAKFGSLDVPSTPRASSSGRHQLDLTARWRAIIFRWSELRRSRASGSQPSGATTPQCCPEARICSAYSVTDATLLLRGVVSSQDRLQRRARPDRVPCSPSARRQAGRRRAT